MLRIEQEKKSDVHIINLWFCTIFDIYDHNIHMYAAVSESVKGCKSTLISIWQIKS